MILLLGLWDLDGLESWGTGWSNRRQLGRHMGLQTLFLFMDSQGIDVILILL